VANFDLFTYEPVLPYNGSSGHSGTDTSKERADTMDKTGKTKDLQLNALLLIDKNGEYGITWGELSQSLNVHHGSASCVLSVLHKEGELVRLKERRGRSKVYVLPYWVNGREIEQRKIKVTTCPNCKHEF
jgi:DNA-binding MarR family transcriptional regulator